MPNTWEDLGWWEKNDIKTVIKIYNLLENACKTPFEGIGQPEPLRANYRSCRINLSHRIVYKVEDYQIVVHSLRGHYQD